MKNWIINLIQSFLSLFHKPKQEILKNFPVKVHGKTYWISRSVACATIVTALDKNDNFKFLVIKRGPKSFQSGKWCIPGGFLDYNEDLTECACRELKEETGITVTPDKLSFRYLHGAPTERQNVVAVYHVHLQERVESINLTDKYSENGEISEIQWKTIEDVKSINWAFSIYKEIVPIIYQIYDNVYLPF